MVVAQLSNDIRQSQTLECRHIAGDETQRRPDPRVLAIDIHAKTRAFFGYVREIEIPAPVEPFLESRREDFLDVTLEFRTAEWIYRGLAVLMLGIAVWFGLRARGRPIDLFREFAIIAATMVLISPLSRKAHFVAMLPAALWIARMWWQTRDRRLLYGLIAAAVVYDVSMYSGSRTFKDYALGAGGYFVASAILWALVVFVRPPADAPEPDATTDAAPAPSA